MDLIQRLFVLDLNLYSDAKDKHLLCLHNYPYNIEKRLRAIIWSNHGRSRFSV